MKYWWVWQQRKVTLLLIGPVGDGIMWNKRAGLHLFWYSKFRHLENRAKQTKRVKHTCHDQMDEQTGWMSESGQASALKHILSLCFLLIKSTIPPVSTHSSPWVTLISLCFFISLGFLPGRSTRSTYRCPAPKSARCAWPCHHGCSLRCSCARGGTGNRSLPPGWSTLYRWHRCSSLSCIH